MSALITPEEARELIPAIDGTEADVRLALIIDAVDSIFANWCAWPAAESGAYTLEAVARTDYIDAPSSEDPTEVHLRVRPVVSVTSVAEDSAADRTYATAVTDHSTFDAAAGILYRRAGWRCGRRATRIRYVAGFVAGELPGNLRFCFQRMARHLWDAGAFADFTQDGQTQYRPFRSPIDIPLEIVPHLRPFQRAEAFGV